MTIRTAVLAGMAAATVLAGAAGADEKKMQQHDTQVTAVSYTHLTLPTNSRV